VLKKITEKLPFINSVAILLLLCLLAFNHFFNSEEVVYVDNMKIFDGFNMTKEMKKVGEKEFITRKAILDSLYAKLQSNTISEAEKKAMMPQFIQGKEEFEQFNQNFALQETEKIWKRINSYVTEFSSENSYKIIIGSENKRDVLYANEKVDITNDLIYYLNKKYEGIK
jgi:outer membrane protein